MTLPPTYVEGFHDKEAVLQMQYNDLGNTGLKVSKLSLGGGPLGGVYGDYLEEEGIETVREAIKKGINYIDTAPAYGQGVSEKVLGKALVGIPRQAYYISTKVSRYGKHWSDMFDRSESRVLSEFDNSLRLLGLDYVDIVYVHDIEFGPFDQVLEEAIPAAAKLVKQKKARHLGISAYPVSIMCNAILKSSYPIEVVLSYSRNVIFDRTLEDYIPFLKSRGIGIVNASLTGMGILTKEGCSPWHPADDDLKELCRKAVEYAEEKGANLCKMSLAYSFNQPGSDSCLIGMTSRSILQENLCVLKWSPDDYQAVLNELKQKFFNLDFDLHWEGKEISQYNKYWEEVNKQK